jgi:hypothetical protein
LNREQAEPEHYSWNLGTPDNAVQTEVIVDPYAERKPPRRKAKVAKKKADARKIAKIRAMFRRMHEQNEMNLEPIDIEE